MDVGHDRLRRFAAEPRPRPRRQRPQLPDHVVQVVGVHPARAPQALQVAPRQHLQIVQQRRHRRIEAVALHQLQLQAFRHGPRHDPRRLEPMAHGQHRLDPLEAAAQPIGELGKLAPQIAALVGRIDQCQSDAVVGRRKSRRRRLRPQMLPQRQGARVRPLAVIPFGQAPARADARPVRQARLSGIGRIGHAVAAALARGRVAVEVVGRGVDRPQRLTPLIGVEAKFPVCGRRLDSGIGRRFRLFALQQRIPLKLGLDELLQLEVRQLQQLDRLLQLGRDDQPLPLPDLQLLPDHRAWSPPGATWPGTC